MKERKIWIIDGVTYEDEFGFVIATDVTEAELDEARKEHRCFCTG